MKYWSEVRKKFSEKDDIIFTRFILSDIDPSLSESAGQQEGEEETQTIDTEYERFVEIQWKM